MADGDDKAPSAREGWTCLLHFAIIASSVLIIYWGTLGFPFHFDDFKNIVENSSVKDASGIPGLFVTIRGPLSYRPLTLASFAANFSLSGLDPVPYRAVNVALHAMAACLLYALLMTVGRATDSSLGRVRWAAFMGAMLFAVHPLQTETVVYVVTRSMLLCACMYFAGLLLFDRVARGGGRMRSAAFAMFSAVVFLGMASREDFITFPAVLLLYDYLILAKGDARAVRARLRLYAPVLAGAAYLIYLVLATDAYKESAGLAVRSISPLEYLMTQFRVHFTYLRLLVFPINQNLDYDYPVAQALRPGAAALALAGYAALWGLGGWLVLSGRRTAAFFMLWSIVVLTPSSSVVPLVDVVFEHRLYLAMAGACALAGMGLTYMLLHPRAKGLALPAFPSAAIAFAALAFATLTFATFAFAMLGYSRARVWSDGVTLWSDAVSKSPEKARPHANLAKAYLAAGLPERAIGEGTRAIALFRGAGAAGAHLNLGNAYRALGMPDEAGASYERAIGLQPEFNEALVNLGVLARARGEHRLALEYYERALRALPDSAELHYNVGNLYMAQGRPGDALPHYERALALNPGDPDVRNNLAAAYEALGRKGGP